MQPDSDQQVPDLQEESMVAEVYTMCLFKIALSKRCMNISTSVWSNLSHCIICELQELGLDNVDLVDEAPSFFELASEEPSE